jgi:hypothetical protein
MGVLLIGRDGCQADLREGCVADRLNAKHSDWHRMQVDGRDGR